MTLFYTFLIVIAFFPKYIFSLGFFNVFKFFLLHAKGNFQKIQGPIMNLEGTWH